MIRAGTIKTSLRYLELLQSKGAEAKAAADGDFLSDNHLAWMCGALSGRLIRHDPEFPIDKASRWLGFIQGVMTTKGYIEVMVERNKTRPLFTGKP